MNSGVSLVTAITVAGVLFALGYARAVWVRARRDYKTTKAAVKPLRKSLWRAIWGWCKVGAAAVVLYAIIVGWFVRDVRDDKDTPLLPERVQPTERAKPTPSCPGGWLRC